MADVRLIDANALDFNRLPAYYGDSVREDDVREWLNNAPTIDAVPVVHGRWEYNPRDYIPYCNRCAMPQDVPTNYCANCGAKMDGGAENA